jgi:hypothetical protein
MCDEWNHKVYLGYYNVQYVMFIVTRITFRMSHTKNKLYLYIVMDEITKFYLIDYNVQ